MANLRTNTISGQGGRNGHSGSVFFAGDNDSYLKVYDTDAFDLGANDFTIEYWFFEDNKNKAERRILYLQDSNQAFVVGHTNDNNGQIFFSAHDSSNNLISGSLVLTSNGSLGTEQMGKWNHVAVVREGSNLKIYLNGALEVTDTGYSTTAIRSDQNTLYIGHDPATSGRNFQGYLSNVRICKGHAVYTSNFTPPRSPLTVHYNSSGDETTLLCCQDSDNALQEATGKSIYPYGGQFPTGTQNILFNSDFSLGTTGYASDSGASISASSNVLTVTNGGGDNLYAVAIYDILRPGGKYRISGTVVPTFSSNTPRFRVRAGGSGVSFQTESLNTGVATFFQTGEVTADGVNLEIGSGESSTITQFTLQNLRVESVEPSLGGQKLYPPYGVDHGVTLGGTTSFNSTGYMCVPSGLTYDRGRGRACIMLGYHGTPSAGDGKRIDTFQIQVMGRTTEFGDLTENRYTMGSGSSSTRGIFCGGYKTGASPDTDVNNIEFITFTTYGTAVDFGDRTNVGRYPAGVSSPTRVVMAGGLTPSGIQNTIDYIQTASIGNATDFGDMSSKRTSQGMPCNSETRGLFCGGYETPANGVVNKIDYITMASTGNAQDFGDLTEIVSGCVGGVLSSHTRGLVALGAINDNPSQAVTNIINYVTIATTGNAADFGDMTLARNNFMSASSLTRGVISGGNDPFTNLMEYVTIATLGNAADFGDIDIGQAGIGAANSDCHGGLS